MEMSKCPKLKTKDMLEKSHHSAYFQHPSSHKATGSSTLVYTSAQFPTIFAPIYTSKYNFKILTSDIKFFTLKISQFTFTDILHFSLCLVK